MRLLTNKLSNGPRLRQSNATKVLRHEDVSHGARGSLVRFEVSMGEEPANVLDEFMRIGIDRKLSCASNKSEGDY